MNIKLEQDLYNKYIEDINLLKEDYNKRFKQRLVENEFVDKLQYYFLDTDIDLLVEVKELLFKNIEDVFYRAEAARFFIEILKCNASYNTRILFLRDHYLRHLKNSPDNLHFKFLKRQGNLLEDHLTLDNNLDLCYNSVINNKKVKKIRTDGLILENLNCNLRSGVIKYKNENLRSSLFLKFDNLLYDEVNYNVSVLERKLNHAIIKRSYKYLTEQTLLDEI